MKNVFFVLLLSLVLGSFIFIENGDRLCAVVALRVR